MTVSKPTARTTWCVARLLTLYLLHACLRLSGQHTSETPYVRVPVKLVYKPSHTRALFLLTHTSSQEIFQNMTTHVE
jgi:hypothetical protein